jgi:hypothetical protein
MGISMLTSASAQDSSWTLQERTLSMPTVVNDAQQSAFNYVRVIEIPTPRWATYNPKTFDVELPNDVPVSIQDRAYTSPIWYTP